MILQCVSTFFKSTFLLTAIIFVNVITGQNRPQLAELNRSIVPVWAAKWRELGEAIGLSSNELEIISADHSYHPSRSEECCKVVLRKWLEKDSTASWNKLKAIESLSYNITENTNKGTYVLS